MPSLQHLRECRAIVRWMLVCFCLSIGVAIASPLVKQQGMVLVCSAAGSAKWVAAADQDTTAPDAVAHSLDCVMCLPAGAPPAAVAALVLSQDLSHVFRAAYPIAPHWSTKAKTSARDPPRFA